MITVNLEYNHGFKWFQKDDIWVKGYLFDESNELYDNERLIEYFANISNVDEFEKKLTIANGSFAVVIEKEDCALVAVDRLRSIPLFYSIANDNDVIITDNANYIKEKLSLKNIDEVKIQEFKLTGYTCGDSTLFKEIKQLRAGEYAEIGLDGHFYAKRYYVHLHQNFLSQSTQALYKKIDIISENIFKRLIESVNGKTIVVPLSGGYDSRYIVAMLKRLKYENVICFTYGRSDSFEVQTSQKVAKQLGYKWNYVPYDSMTWDMVFNSKHNKYFKYASNLSSLPHIQDFFAIMNLTNKKIIPPDAVIVPGYCGDLLGGSYLVDDNNIDISMDGIVNYLYDRHFNLTDNNVSCKHKILRNLESEIKSYRVTNKDEFISINEDWFTCQKVAKFVVNAVRIYEYFGYEWRMPLWDNKLMEFWYKIPSHQRIDKILYDGYLFDYLFKQSNIDFVTANKRSSIRTVLKKILPKVFIDSLKRIHVSSIATDKKNFNSLFEMYDRLAKDLENVKFDDKYTNTNVNHIYSLWFLKKQIY